MGQRGRDPEYSIKNKSTGGELRSTRNCSVENACIELIPRHCASRSNVDLCYYALYGSISAIVTTITPAAYR
jgi:hypothetical protein